MRISTPTVWTRQNENDFTTCQCHLHHDLKAGRIRSEDYIEHRLSRIIHYLNDISLTSTCPQEHQLHRSFSYNHRKTTTPQCLKDPAYVKSSNTSIMETL